MIFAALSRLHEHSPHPRQTQITMRYATIALALATAAAIVPSLAYVIHAQQVVLADNVYILSRPIQAREELDLYTREFDNELVARAKGRPRPVGSGPNKPKPERPQRRWDLDSLSAREIEADELVARADELLSRGDPHKLSPYWKPRPKKREDIDELFERSDFDEELFARGDPHKLSPYWKPRPKKREDIDGLFERSDLEELFAREDVDDLE